MGASSRKVPLRASRNSSCFSSSQSSLHHVGLGEDHQALLDLEQLADLQVLPGLGHDAFVGGDHQGHQVHAGGAGHHVAHEALVARARQRYPGAGCSGRTRSLTPAQW